MLNAERFVHDISYYYYILCYNCYEYKYKLTPGNIIDTVDVADRPPESLAMSLKSMISNRENFDDRSLLTVIFPSKSTAK